MQERTGTGYLKSLSGFASPLIAGMALAYSVIASGNREQAGRDAQQDLIISQIRERLATIEGRLTK